MSEAFERVRDALASRGSKMNDVRQNHFVAQCPAHDDKNPSLGVDAKDGKVLIRCYTGVCQTDEIVEALGMELKDLFDGSDFQVDKHTGLLIRSYLYECPNGAPWFYVDRYWPKVFRQRLPDVEPVRDLGDREACKRLGLRGRAPLLYHLPRLLRLMKNPEYNRTVWWLDGEKDVETAERHNLVATCPPGFAKWNEEYAARLKQFGVETVVMVVDQDKEKPNGELGAGQANAVQARMGFRSVGIKVRVVAPAAGKDLTDHFTAKYGVDDFVPEPTIYTRPRGMSASELATKEFDPIKWAVDCVLPSGLCIAAGAPKAGKSWLGLDLCLAVAAGGPALSALGTQQGSALYLAREDTYRRLQSRMALLMGGSLSDMPKALELIPAEQEWVGGEEGLANLTEWADEVGDPRLVVIDTLAKVEPEMGEEGRRTNAYSGNYSMMARYKRWADEHDCAVLMIHHDRKQQASAPKDGPGSMESDPFSRISGTRGLTGAADTLWFLDRVRGSSEGFLHITGRDVAEQTLELRKAGPLWMATHQPEKC